MKTTKQRIAKPRKPKATTRKKTVGFTAEERAAMKEYIQEKKAEARRGADKAEGERAVLAKIAKLPPSDRALAKKVHEIVTAHASMLIPKTWYGMPAYAKDDKVVCYFQDAHKFKSRYAILGFSDKAKLDDGRMWPTVYALKEITAAEEARIVALLKTALG